MVTVRDADNISPKKIPYVDRLESVYLYVGTAGLAVRELKYRSELGLAQPMARQIAALYELEFEGTVDFIVPVPMHWRKQWDRGFNQSELLSRGLPIELRQKKLLKRVKLGSPQAGIAHGTRSLEFNQARLSRTFQANNLAAGARVLLIDDVVTSGETLSACAKVLKEEGAVWVGALTYARG